LRARNIFTFAITIPVLFLLSYCGTGGEVVTISIARSGEGLDHSVLSKLEKIKKTSTTEGPDNPLSNVIAETPHLSVSEYLSKYPRAKAAAGYYTVGGYDVLNIKVYEEADLTREEVRVSGDGYITFPLIGKLKVAGLSSTEIERLISDKLAEQQYLLNAHVSVTVTGFFSKHFMVLGAVKNPGSYPLQPRERVLDGVSKAGGVELDLASTRAMIIRTLSPDSDSEQKIVININLKGLLKRGDQVCNIYLMDKDALYVPPAEHFYIMGQVRAPGAYTMPEGEMTLVEAIGVAGGFTRIAARNSTRIIRVEEGVQKIIEVKVDAITEAGKKIHDVPIKPGDIIVIPESFF
jgi:polysaccharide export outer membrane protein